MKNSTRYELICVPGRDDEPGVWFCHRPGHSIRCASRAEAVSLLATLNDPKEPTP